MMVAQLFKGWDKDGNVWMYRNARAPGHYILQKADQTHVDAERDILLGAKYGYPLCCVAQYVNDCVAGILPGLVRPWTVRTMTGFYVPCWGCLAVTN